MMDCGEVEDVKLSNIKKSVRIRKQKHRVIFGKVWYDKFVFTETGHGENREMRSVDK